MQSAVYLTIFCSSQLQLAPDQGSGQFFLAISSLILLLLPHFLLALATFFFFIFTYFLCECAQSLLLSALPYLVSRRWIMPVAYFGWLNQTNIWCGSKMLVNPELLKRNPHRVTGNFSLMKTNSYKMYLKNICCEIIQNNARHWCLKCCNLVHTNT